MRRAALAMLVVAATVGVAGADDHEDAYSYTPTIDFYKMSYDATITPPTEADVLELKEIRRDLLQRGNEAYRQCEVTWAHAGDDADARAAVVTWMQKVFDGLYQSRYATVLTIEALFPTTEIVPWVADALFLLRDLHMDQIDTIAQQQFLFGEGVEPCEMGEVTDGLRYDQSYYAAAAERAMVDNYPTDARRDVALRDLAELYADLDWEDALLWTLRELLCPGAGDDQLERELDSIDQELGQRLYGGSTIDYRTCTPSPVLEGDELISAWLQLADHEHNAAGRREAELAARERAISVPDTVASLGVFWELATAYLGAGMRIEAIPVLDRVAEQAMADGTQVELGAEAVAKIGATLALLWRESSLPTPDAALKLAQIYFHQGRRKQPHVRGIYEALAGSLRELGAYEQAASVERDVVASWPLHKMAPSSAAILIDIEVERGDREAADVARSELVARFGAGSKWADANGADAAAVLVDETRLALARSRYQAAVQVAERDPKNAGFELTIARGALDDLVASSPSLAHALEGRYLLGEIQALQADSAAAARSFDAVATALPTDTPLRRAAVQKMVAAWEAAVDQAVAAGTLVLPAVPGDLGALTGKEPVEMPEEVAALRHAYDTYVPVLDRDEDVAQALLAAARLDLRYLHLDDAERGLRSIVAEHCFTASARDARDAVVALVRGRDGSAAADEITKDVTARGCLDTAKALAARDKDLEKQLDRARAMVAKSDHAGAAKLLEREYELTPSTSALADDVLYEAALAWQAAGQGAAAARLLDELDRRAELAISPRIVDMRWTRAVLLERQLDWPAAAKAYLAAAAAAGPKKGQKKADADKREVNAVFNAAEMLAADHAWADRGDDPGAITLFLRVARKARDVGVVNAAWLRAADLARRAGKREQLAAIHTEWRKGHSDRDLGLQLEFMKGQAAEAAGDRKGAETHYREVVTKGWTVEGLGAEAEDAVVASKFWLADEALRTDTVFKAFRWGKDQADDQKRLEVLGKRLEDLGTIFLDIGKRSPKWTVAGAVRFGDVVLAAIEAFVSIPPPSWLLELMRGQGGDHGTDHAEGMRQLMENEYTGLAQQLHIALDAEKVPGTEPWRRLAEQRLAEIGSFVNTVGGARTEAFVEEL